MDYLPLRPWLRRLRIVQKEAALCIKLWSPLNRCRPRSRVALSLLLRLRNLPARARLVQAATFKRVKPEGRPQSRAAQADPRSACTLCVEHVRQLAR